MLKCHELAIELGRVDVAIRDSFATTLFYLHTGAVSVGHSKLVKIDGSIGKPLVIAERCFIVVNGDLTTPIDLPSGGVLLIHGNLDATVKSSSHVEIVVAGYVEPNALIEANDICHVFAAEGFSGRLTAAGMTLVWVKGTFDGFIKTGSPSMTIYIEQDCNGSISPIDQAAMLYLSVGGFMSAESLRCIDYYGYVEFKAAIARSDQPAGMYPTKASVVQSALGGIIARRWVVLSGEESEHNAS